MAGTGFNLRIDKWGLRGRSLFTVLIIYEEVTTGQRAMRMMRDLLRESGAHSDFEPSLWKLDLLVVPKFRELAAREAATADMVVVSAHDRDTLPVAIQTWAEAWPSRIPANRGALVALLELTEDQTEARPETVLFLRKVAEQAGMDFFVQLFRPPARGTELTVEQIAQRAGTVSSVLDDILHHPAPAPRWGINE